MIGWHAKNELGRIRFCAADLRSVGNGVAPLLKQRSKIRINIQNYDSVAADAGEQAHGLEHLGFLLQQQRHILRVEPPVVGRLMWCLPLALRFVLPELHPLGVDGGVRGAYRQCSHEANQPLVRVHALQSYA